MREPAAPPPPRHDGPVPPELAVGALAEVWAVDGADLLDARRRYGVARLAWESQTGLDRPTSYALLPASRPWRMSDADAAARLDRDGITAAHIPELRAAAAARVALDPNPHRRTP